MLKLLKVFMIDLKTVFNQQKSGKWYPKTLTMDKNIQKQTTCINIELRMVIGYF